MSRQRRRCESLHRVPREYARGVVVGRGDEELRVGRPRYVGHVVGLTCVGSVEDEGGELPAEGWGYPDLDVATGGDGEVGGVGGEGDVADLLLEGEAVEDYAAVEVYEHAVVGLVDHEEEAVVVGYRHGGYVGPASCRRGSSGQSETPCCPPVTR